VSKFLLDFTGSLWGKKKKVLEIWDFNSLFQLALVELILFLSVLSIFSSVSWF